MHPTESKMRAVASLRISLLMLTLLHRKSEHEHEHMPILSTTRSTKFHYLSCNEVWPILRLFLLGSNSVLYQLKADKAIQSPSPVYSMTVRNSPNDCDPASGY